MVARLMADFLDQTEEDRGRGAHLTSAAYQVLENHRAVSLHRRNHRTIGRVERQRWSQQQRR